MSEESRHMIERDRLRGRIWELIRIGRKQRDEINMLWRFLREHGFVPQVVPQKEEANPPEAKYEELHTACLEYLKSPPTNVPARRKFAEIVTGGSCDHLDDDIVTEQHECDWRWFIDYVTPEAGFKCLHGHTIDLYQAQARLNEAETLKEMLNELIDCHYGIKDRPSKEMAEKINAHYWKPRLGRKDEV